MQWVATYLELNMHEPLAEPLRIRCKQPEIVRRVHREYAKATRRRAGAQSSRQLFYKDIILNVFVLQGFL